MSILNRIKPDLALKSLLLGRVVSDTGTLEVYEKHETPNLGLSADFIQIFQNGGMVSLTNPPGRFRGDLALLVYIATDADGTANRIKADRLLGAVEDLIQRKGTDYEGIHYVFEVSSEPITPLTTDTTTGQSYTTLNVEWHN
jgi:hypothetical protein